MDRIYPDHNSIDDYLGLLRNKAKHGRKVSLNSHLLLLSFLPNVCYLTYNNITAILVRQLRDPLASSRMSPEVLKKKLEEEFDEEEEAEEEDEEGIK